MDVALLALPIDQEHLVVEPLFTEELLLAMPADHRLARKRHVTMQGVSTQPFVLLNEAHCLGEQVISLCRQKSCLPIVSCQSVQLLTVQEMVALGHGLSLIPQMAVAGDTSGHRRYRSLAGEKPQRSLAMIWRRHRYQSGLVKQFIENVRQEARERAG